MYVMYCACVDFYWCTLTSYSFVWQANQSIFCIAIQLIRSWHELQSLNTQWHVDVNQTVQGRFFQPTCGWQLGEAVGLSVTA